MKKNEMGWAFDKYGGQERGIHGVGRRDLRERDHLEELSIVSRVILKCIFGSG
jgi:hypothetical protein